MYLGKMVEYGPAEQVFSQAAHPYTQALFAAIPTLDTEGIDSIATIEGNVPSAINPPSGCRFHTRCPMAKDICSQKEPAMVRLGGGHTAACHFINQK